MILKPHQSRRRQRGQAAIEYAIYIAIAAIVLAGIIYFINQARHRAQMNTEISNVTSIVQSTQKLYRGSPNGYSGVDATVLINNGVIPDTMVSGGNSILSAFGTPVTVSPTSVYGTNDGIQFNYQVSPSQCSDFIQGVAPLFAKITVGSAVKDVTTGTMLDPAQLGSQCQASSSNKVLNVTFVATR